MQSFFMRTTKTGEIARLRRLICIFIGCICQKVRFLRVRLMLWQIKISFVFQTCGPRHEEGVFGYIKIFLDTDQAAHARGE